MLALSELYFFQNDLNFGKFYVFHLPCIFKILHFSENESQVSTLCRSLSLDAADVEGKFRLISALLSKYAIVSGFREIYSWKKKRKFSLSCYSCCFLSLFVCSFGPLDGKVLWVHGCLSFNQYICKQLFWESSHQVFLKFCTAIEI